ncbi:hypothetical protein JCM3775_002449 [Rhodotorula graminis]
MRPPAPTNPAQVPLLGAASSCATPPTHSHPSLLANCFTRRTRSLVQLAIAATLVTASVAFLRHAAPTPSSSSLSLPSLPPHLASVLRLSAPVDRPPAPTRLAVKPDRPVATADDDHPGEPDLDAFSSDHGDGLLTDLTTVLKPLARTKAVSYGEPWVYARDPHQLPACERILLFQFMPWWGFASEYILYARAAAAADKLGYTFLEDDRNWNYGRLRNYFRPRKLSCVPPRDWTDQRLAVPFSLASARERPPRLVYSRLHLSNLDDWTRDVYLSAPGVQAALRALQQRDDAHRRDADRWILEEGATLPQPLEAVFDDQSAAVRRMWKLNAEVDAQVKLVRRRSGLARPRWVTGEEDAPEGGEGTTSRRGPVIALHVRLGDKASEYEHDSQDMGISNSFGNLTVYVEAAHDAFRRLLPSRYPSLTPLTRPRFSPYARPSLLLITAEPDIPSRLRASTPLSRPFLVVQTPEPDVRVPSATGDGDGTQARLAKQAGAAAGAQGDKPKAYGGGSGGARKAQKGRKGAAAAAVAVGKDGKERVRRAAGGASEGEEDEVVEATPDLSTGYTQAAFNALPILERVVHTQAFVRDLTVLAREADAAVVSGASNVGRLTMLIAGKDAVVGPRDSHGDGLGGRIRSVDAHCYPTAYTTAVYEPVADVEDLDNAAFVPKEQFEAEQAALAAKAQRVDKGRKGRKGRPTRDE